MAAVPSDRSLDEGIAESFPASDPLSVSITRLEAGAGDDDDRLGDGGWPRDDGRQYDDGHDDGHGADPVDGRPRAAGLPWATFVGGALFGLVVGLAIELARARR